MLPELTKEQFEEIRKLRKSMEQEVRSMYLDHYPKSHIAKHFQVPVYEITKILTTKRENVEEIFVFRKYHKIAKKIYWEHELHKTHFYSLATRYGVSLWMAQELFKLFKKKMNEEIDKPPKLTKR